MTSKPTMRPKACSLYYIPVETRVPLKFGHEVTTRVTCARAEAVLEDGRGGTAAGWGETPLSVAWLWPSERTYAERDDALRRFCRVVAAAFALFPESGHPMEVGHLFMERELPGLLDRFNREHNTDMPWLAALACFSPIDIAMHDAYATRLGLGVYDIYTAEYMHHDLSWFFGQENGRSFVGHYPEQYLADHAPDKLVAWHLVGGRDLLTPAETAEDGPEDGYPIHLTEWIKRDGLQCLKIKLRGNDAEWDYRRILAVGDIGLERGVRWLSPDFNCTVRDVGYVTDILDRLAEGRPDLYRMLLYVEQPFPYDLERNRLDVRPVSRRKPLFMDESAHSWRQVALGRELGWTGVALKTCKTQTGALLSLCWARAHGMGIMVQDLTNPMLAQIAHVQLAAHADTIMGVESNAMQFYPEASRAEARVHPGLYERREGRLDLRTLGGIGFGYRVDEIRRALPPAEVL